MTLSVVSLAIYAVLNNGLKVWQKVNTEIPESEVSVFFDRFSLDLKNCIKFKSIPFSGDRERFGFATIVNSKGLGKTSVGEVSYSYDSGEKSLNRLQRDFSQAYTKEDVPAMKVLGRVESATLRYYYYNKDTKEYLWKDEWQREDLPLAVRMELEFNNGKERTVFTGTVNIPASG